MTDADRSGALLNRREAAQLMVLASAGAALAPLGGLEAAPFAGRAEELRAFMKLQSRADEGYTNYFNSGTVYAAIPARQSIPLYRYEGLLRFHTRILGPDLYEVTFIEAGTYLDLKTGEPLERFANPVTGVTNKVDHIVEGPMQWRWTVESLHVKAPEPVLRRHVAWQHAEGQSSLYFDNMIAAPLPGGGVFNAAALATYVGQTSQIADHKRSSVTDTVLIDSSINPWAPWLAMGDRPGRLANNIIGRKLGAMTEAPDRLLRHIAATNPRVLKSVDGWKAAGA